MKPLKTLIVSFTLIAAMISCEKDEAPEMDADASIVGYWQATKEIEIEFEDGKKVEESTNTSPNLIIEFRNDKRIYEDGKSTGTYQISNDKKKLTVVNELETIIFDIKQLSKSTLVLYTEYTETEDEKTYQENYEVHYIKTPFLKEPDKKVKKYILED